MPKTHFFYKILVVGTVCQKLLKTVSNRTVNIERRGFHLFLADTSEHQNFVRNGFFDLHMIYRILPIIGASPNKGAPLSLRDPILS